MKFMTTTPSLLTLGLSAVAAQSGAAALADADTSTTVKEGDEPEGAGVPWLFYGLIVIVILVVLFLVKTLFCKPKDAPAEGETDETKSLLKNEEGKEGEAAATPNEEGAAAAGEAAAE